jgi:hypothetical protein
MNPNTAGERKSSGFNIVGVNAQNAHPHYENLFVPSCLRDLKSRRLKISDSENASRLE